MTKEKFSFLNYFSKASWDNLPAEEKTQHQLCNCTACLQPPHLNYYINLRRNADAFYPEFVKHSTTAEIAAFVADHRQQLQTMKLSQSLINIGYWQTVAADVSNLLTCSKATESAANTPPKVKKPKKITPIKPDRFEFDKASIRQKVLASMISETRVNWLAMSREHPVMRRDGKPATHAHGAQVIKTYVLNEGLLNQNDKRCRRRSRSELAHVGRPSTPSRIEQ